MSNFKLHFKNPFDSAFSDANDTAFLTDVENEFTPKSYDKEYKDLYLLAFFGSFLCNVVSASTAATHVYSFLAAVIPYTALSTLLTGVCLLFLEGAKRFIAPKFFKAQIQFKMFKVGFFCVALALVGLSTYLSYLGAKKVIFATAAPVMLTDVSSVTADYDKQITDIEKSKNAYFEANKVRENGKDVLAYNSRKGYAAFETQIAGIRNKRNAAKETTETKNTAKETANQLDTSGSAEYFAAFTVLIELLFLLCSYYVIYYRFRSFVDRTKFAETARNTHAKDADKHEKDIAETPNIQHLTETTQPQKTGNIAPKTQIGFVLPEKKNDTANDTKQPEKIGFILPSKVVDNQHITQNVNSSITQSVISPESTAQNEAQNTVENEAKNEKVTVTAHFKIGEKAAPFTMEFGDIQAAEKWKSHIHKDVPIQESQGPVTTAQKAANFVVKICENCGKDYERKVTFQRFCAPECKYEWHKNEKGTDVKMICEKKAKQRKKTAAKK